MNSFSFLLILVAMGVAIYWYVMNIELSKDGNTGLFAMVDETDDGELVRMRELSRRAKRTTKGNYASAVRHKLAILEQQAHTTLDRAKTKITEDMPVIVAAAVPAEKQPSLPQRGIKGAAPLAGVDHQPKTMRARVHVASTRTAREKVQEKMKQPNRMSPDEEKAAIMEYNRILKERESKSLSEIAKGDDQRHTTREATVFAARVKNTHSTKDDFLGSTRTPDRMLSGTKTGKPKYKKREKTSAAYRYKQSAVT